MASKLHLEIALTPDGPGAATSWSGSTKARSWAWRRPRRRRRARLRRRGAGPAEPAQPCLPARHGGPHGTAGQRERFLLDLARRHVPLRRTAGTGRARGDRRFRLHGNARSRLHAGRRVPLSAPPARRPSLRQCRREMSERIVAGAASAGIGLTLLPVLYRQSCFLGKAPSPAQRRFVCDRDSYARLMETPVPAGNIGIAPHFPARRDPGRSAMGGAHLAWPARHIHVARAGARGRGLPGRPWPAANRPAARYGRGRCPPLVPGPCHACRCQRAGAHGQGTWPRSAVPDHPKPISATACSTYQPSSPKAASSASARTP